MSDWKLALVVLVLVMVDLVILVVYTAVEGARGNLEAEKVENRENLSDVKGVSLDSYVMHGATITFWMVWRYCNGSKRLLTSLINHLSSVKLGNEARNSPWVSL